MKNQDDQTLLAHKRRVDAQRKAAAIQRKADEKAAQQKNNWAMMRKVGGQK